MSHFPSSNLSSSISSSSLKKTLPSTNTTTTTPTTYSPSTSESIENESLTIQNQEKSLPTSISTSSPFPSPSPSSSSSSFSSSHRFSSYLDTISSLGSYVYSFLSPSVSSSSFPTSSITTPTTTTTTTTTTIPSSSASSKQLSDPASSFNSTLFSHSFASSDLSPLPPFSFPSYSDPGSFTSSCSPVTSLTQLDQRARSESILSALSTEPNLTLKEREEDTNPILTLSMANAIRKCLPSSDRLSETWTLIYSIDQHGASLNSLYYFLNQRVCMKNFQAKTCLLLIQDSNGKIFGAYLTDPLKVHPSFYGNGETFVFEWNDTTQEIFPYPWTGENEYFMYGEHGYFAIGSGEGHFAIFLDSNLEFGKSYTVPTFNNPVLSSTSDFTCINLEVWGFD